MNKKHPHHDKEMTAEQEAEMVRIRDANRPIAGQTQKPADRETLSHLWQEGSAAVVTNVLSEHANTGDSILTKIDSPENLEAREEAKKLAEFTFEDQDDCSKRDVSDPLYCQPGSERHKAFKKNK